jgi:hypothetical protein
MPNTRPIFSKKGDIQGGVILTTAAADYNGQNVNNAVLFTADETNGGLIERIRAKALGTNVASVLRIYINNGLGRLASLVAAPAGTPTGTPSAAGGTLLGGPYFAKIVAIDRYGAESAPSTESASVSVTGPTGSITWNWTASANAASYRIYVGGVTGGQVVYFTSTTNSYVQTTDVPVSPAGGRDSINGSNTLNWLHCERSLPATIATQVAGTLDLEIPLGLAMPMGSRILVGLGTTVAAGWAIQAIGGAY